MAIFHYYSAVDCIAPKGTIYEGLKEYTKETWVSTLSVLHNSTGYSMINY